MMNGRLGFGGARAVFVTQGLQKNAFPAIRQVPAGYKVRHKSGAIPEADLQATALLLSSIE
jgi:hypothetical protein